MMDVFTKTGFVIEGKKFSSRDAAAGFLIRTGDMAHEEAYNYLNVLVRAYKKRVQLGQDRAVLGQREGV